MHLTYKKQTKKHKKKINNNNYKKHQTNIKVYGLDKKTGTCICPNLLLQLFQQDQVGFAIRVL